jgi:hypothetical protein
MAGLFSCGNEPPVSVKCGEFLVRETVSLSGRTLPHGDIPPLWQECVRPRVFETGNAGQSTAYWYCGVMGNYCELD